MPKAPGPLPGLLSRSPNGYFSVPEIGIIKSMGFVFCRITHNLHPSFSSIGSLAELS